jgi:hypothetical protein
MLLALDRDDETRKLMPVRTDAMNRAGNSGVPVGSQRPSLPYAGVCFDEEPAHDKPRSPK